MAKFYNRKVSDKEPKFKIGDWVMLSAKEFKTIRPSKKLDHKMRGKFQVKRLIGPHAYELELPVSTGKHPVFHISQLEPYHQNKILDRRTPTPPPEEDLDGELNYVVEEILASRVRYRKVQYLVKWQGYGPDDNTWEPYDNLMSGAEDSVKDFHKKNPDSPRDARVIY